MQATFNTHHFLFALVAGMLATLSGRAQAQESSPYARDTDPTLTLATAPSASTDAPPHLLSLAELQERDATLTRRLKGYRVGFAASVVMVGVSLAFVYRSPCFFDLFDTCPAWSDRELVRSTAVTVTGAIGWHGFLSGLITAGARRRRVRQRIDTLKLTPVASVSPQGTVGGASLHLTW